MNKKTESNPKGAGRAKLPDNVRKERVVLFVTKKEKADVKAWLERLRKETRGEV